MSRARICLVWAQANGGVIGAGGTMPWHLPEDLARFKELTMGHAVLMGRATWFSLPERFRPLPGRTNLVLSRQAGLQLPGARVVGSLAEAVAHAVADVVADGAAEGDAAADGAAEGGAEGDAVADGKTDGRAEGELWVIGGAQVYAATIGAAQRLEVTEIDLDVPGDAHSPAIGPEWRRTAAGDWLVSRSGLRYRFVSYRRATA